MQPYQMAYNQYPTHVQQAQYPMQQQQIPTQMNAHPPIQNSPLQLLPPQNTTRPTQLPVQPIANPNNKTIQAPYNVDIQTYPTYPTYLISTIPLQGVQLRSGRDLSQIKSPVTIEEEPELNSKQMMGDEATNENNAATLKEQTL
ncbi:unnamed protein product, partial [Adineta steineri]